MRSPLLLLIITSIASAVTGCAASDDSAPGYVGRPLENSEEGKISLRQRMGSEPPVGGGGEGGEGSGGGGGGAGGAAPGADVTAVGTSPGCGKELPPDHAVGAPGTRTGYQEYHVQQTGANLVNVDPLDAVDRLFWVRPPSDYDPSKPYRVVYIGQGCGGGNGRDNVYTLFNEAQGGTEEAIYVAVALPPNNPNGPCYDNNAGEESMEWEAFELFHTVVTENYCVDSNRVFVSGYSTGGWLANMWGCYFAGVDPARMFAPEFSVRGQLSTTGGYPAVPDCGGPVAGFWLHDEFDSSNPIAGNYNARDSVLARNGCTGSPEEAWGEGELAQHCVQYTDCPAEYPVVFCTTQSQGHGDQPNTAIPAYTQFMDMLEPQ